MEESSLTVEILKQIRDEIRATREDLGGRIDQTNQRLDQTNQCLDHVESTLLELAEKQRFVVRHVTTVRQREDDIEREIGLLKTRMDAVEHRLDAGH